MLEQNLDPRIGIFANGLHYAFTQGYDKTPFVGTRHQVEVALGLRADVPSVKAAKRPAIRVYEVNAVPKFPAWDEADGFTYEILAESRAEAISRARDHMRDDGHIAIGPILYRARIKD